jgi:hypothetical protein
MRVRKFFFLPFIAAIFFTGCAGYHLGAVNGQIAGNQSIEILPFNNKTLEPRLAVAVTQALREQIQTDGTYHLATHGAADVIVTGNIISYGRQSLSYLDTDAITPENYRINITAHIVARMSDSDKIILEKDVSGFTLVHVGTDLASAERQAFPLLAADLAHNVTELLTEGAW